MTSRYQWDINAQTKHAPTSAERRFAPVRAFICHPSGVRICFCGLFPGFRPLRGSTAGYYMAPLRGSELGSLALANYPTIPPSTSGLSLSVKSGISSKTRTATKCLRPFGIVFLAIKMAFESKICAEDEKYTKQIAGLARHQE